MGRKTFESLGKVLPNRYHVVLTKNRDFNVNDLNVEIVNDVKDLDKYINSNEECFVIGGASIYEMLMPFSKKMYVTRINENFEADTFFPEINEKEWEITKTEKGIKDEKNIYDYEFLTYERK